MRLNIESTFPLWFLLPAVIVILFGYYKYAQKDHRQKVFMVLRLLAVTLIILSVCSVSIVKSAKETATLFICDLSDSTLDRQKIIERFVEDAISSKGEDDIVGIIGFGTDSYTENQPAKDIIFTGFQSYVNGDFTNIQNALIHGTAIFPPNVKKRIVLITDGLENAGDSERQIRVLGQNNTMVDVYPIAKGDFPEVQLDQVIVPEKAGINQVIDITTHIESNVETEATLFLYAGNELKYQQKVEIDEGTNKFVFTDTVSQNGILTYRVEILPENDTYSQNNYLSSFISVMDRPIILLIQDEEGQGEQLIKMFEDKVELDVMLPEEAPQTFENLLKYDAFILADVSYERLNEKFIQNLQNVVKNNGKGLLVTGGDSSYGPGGYYQTPLEEMLPVNVDIKPKEEKPNLGLVLVIDKSGSMTEGQYGISKLELAKEAAIRSTDVLESKDMLGVIAFDDTVKWVVDMQYVLDQAALQDMIATIRPGGGTSIRPALEAAVDVLIEADTKLKHIILLTDGQAETTGYEKAVRELSDNQITLSTVAVGSGADKKLLEALANAGGGRYYETDEFSDIPSIFTKEAFMAGKKYLNNVTFSPTLINYSQVLKGIEAVPELDGYVATTIKDSARLILAGPETDPILATWQYGLGRTIAWTSDANGLWTSKWQSWESSPVFWMNLVSWLVQRDLDSKYTVETDYLTGQGVITLKSIEKESVSVPSISGVIITPSGEEKEITLEATSPGTYTGVFDTEGEGVYLANLQFSANGETQYIVTGLNVGYSPEYDFYSDSGITAARITQISGGRILTNAKEVFKGYVPPVQGSNNISNLLLVLGLLVFMSEIIIRKTQIKFAFLGVVSSKVKDAASTVVEKVDNYRQEQKQRVKNEEFEKPKNKEKAVVQSKPKPDTKGKESSKKKETSKVDSAHLEVLLNKKRKREQ